MKTENLLCNLIGAIEILEVAKEKADKKSFDKAFKKIIELKNEIKTHESYNRETGINYD